jgi:hypothetical protein
VALLKAVCLGGVAATGLPYIMRNSAGQLADAVRELTMRITAAGGEIRFSLVIFLAVTLFSWAFFYWSNK